MISHAAVKRHGRRVTTHEFLRRRMNRIERELPSTPLPPPPHDGRSPRARLTAPSNPIAPTVGGDEQQCSTRDEGDTGRAWTPADAAPDADRGRR